MRFRCYQIVWRGLRAVCALWWHGGKERNRILARRPYSAEDRVHEIGEMVCASHPGWISLRGNDADSDGGRLPRERQRQSRRRRDAESKSELWRPHVVNIV